MTTAEDNIIDENIKENRRGLIMEMFDSMNQYRVIAKEIKGRKIRISNDNWVTDFASCNYLGLDLDEEMDDFVSEEIKKWGVHPSWCRLVASPEIYSTLEKKIAELIGTEDSIIFPTVTLISLGVIPALVGKSGLLILDKSGHETMYEAAKVARDSGATFKSFEQGDFETLEKILSENKNNPRKVIMIDGVYSMTGDFADIPKLVSIARKYDAILYIDDAHGFGVVGENPNEKHKLGFKGNGIVKYYGLDYENIIYVGGCSKAYSSLAAFVGCGKKMKKFIEAFATPYDLSGPCPTASLATLLKGLEINEKRGDLNRANLLSLTEKTIAGLRELGFTVLNKTYFPIVSVHIGDTKKLVDTANILLKEGILVTVCPYPMVKKGDEVHRITITSANTNEEVDKLINAFEKVKIYLESKYP